MGPTVSTLAPGLSIDPYPELNCGPYAFDIIWPVDLVKIYNMLTWSTSTGEIEIISALESDVGLYDLKVKIFLTNFPGVEIEAPLQVNIGQCTQEVIEPPAEHIEDQYFPIGSTAIKIEMESFIQTPACSADLIYTLLDENGSELDSDM